VRQARLLPILAILAALAIVLGACGEGDDEIDATVTAQHVATSQSGSQAATAHATPLATGTASEQGSASPGAGSPTTATEGQGDVNQWTAPPAMQLEADKDYSATIHTNKGDIVVDLFESEVPITVNNFVFLAQQGYYTNVPFHRVISGFMIQTGDPTGTGRGGPGYTFQDEKVARKYERGVVAMANAGPNTNGSQFFICQGPNVESLPPNYTIFGEVTSGMDVVDAIANVPVGPSDSGEQSKPLEPVTMLSVDISTK